jgi:hypothetical protein
MQIVEINISMADINDNLNYLKDMQARVIECDSWDKYVSYYTNYNGEPVGNCRSVNGGLAGCVLPKMAEIYDLDYDDHKLTCTVYLFNNHVTKKIACVVQ